ncbi:hypothetical protein DVH24_002198 [Malus domestica]|uniref:Uncharacterized protein n=1 Tax=Malus domestica TaxID=3750 RepID=A0A498I619_MALDO|nr:hypothetical protein DVH24_002198 [Malus domestica]
MSSMERTLVFKNFACFTHRGEGPIPTTSSNLGQISNITDLIHQEKDWYKDVLYIAWERCHFELALIIPSLTQSGLMLRIP